MSRAILPLLAAPSLLLVVSCASSTWAEPHATPRELEAHVEWLADDAREGRRAGTPGELAAAKYIAAEMEAAGLQPAGDDGTWFQEFEVRLAPEPGAVTIEVTGEALAGGGTVAASASTEAVGPLVSAGYGVVLESHGMNDFADAGVEGSIVLVRRYSEFGPNPPAEMEALGSLRAKIRNAAAAGAVGVVLGTHPDDLEKGGDAEIAFASVPGTMPIPVVTLPPASFASLERRCREQEDGSAGDARIAAEIVQPTAIARNVLGVVPGDSPTSQLLVVGAHFDHLGWGGQGSLAPGVHAIHNGADDNASGTAVMLEVAEEWGTTSIGTHPRKVGVLFAAWSAEEMGLLGSAHWVENPTVDLGRVAANVNLDMVGRVAEGRITVGSAYTADGFKPSLDSVQQDLIGAGYDLKLQVVEGELPGGGGSDHMSFHKMGIPALFFFSGLHSDYHKPTDDTEKIDFIGMAEVSFAVSDLLVYLQQEAERKNLVYRKPQPAEGGGERQVRAAKVWFGSIPDYGAQPEGGGMQLAGASPGGPAEKAGLKTGDILKKIGDAAIGDIYDFMDALADFKNGDTVTVVFLREGKEQQVELTFFPRPNGDA